MSKDALKANDIVCLGHLDRVFSRVDCLRDVGCARDTAGNRRLFYNDYVKLVLVYCWNPLLHSISDLQQTLAIPKIAKKLGIKRFSAGSFSESVRVFDPEQLRPIVEELARQITPSPRDRRLGEFKDAFTLVDGTVIRTLTRMARSAVGFDARCSTNANGTGVYGWRLHTQFDLQTFTVHRIDRTGARNARDNREANVLRRTLEAGRCYVGDTHYSERSVLKDISDAGSTYVMRVAENSAFPQVAEDERLLTQEALDAGIVRDVVANIEGVGMVRRVAIQVQPHVRRTWASGSSYKRQCDLLIVHTNVLDLPPEVVALIYRYRYTVELFFRILKQLFGLRHLLSQRQEGIDIQIYCALIVCVLIQLISGKKPNKKMRNIIGWYLLGLAEAQDVINFLNKPDNTGVKLRKHAEFRKKMGY